MNNQYKQEIEEFKDRMEIEKLAYGTTSALSDDFLEGYRIALSFASGEARIAFTSIEKQARSEERDVMKEKIEECGHQQEDGSIWCNMDELVKALTQSNP